MVHFCRSVRQEPYSAACGADLWPGRVDYDNVFTATTVAGAYTRYKLRNIFTDAALYWKSSMTITTVCVQTGFLLCFILFVGYGVVCLRLPTLFAFMGCVIFRTGNVLISGSFESEQTRTSLSSGTLAATLQRPLTRQEMITLCYSCYRNKFPDRDSCAICLVSDLDTSIIRESVPFRPPLDNSNRPEPLEAAENNRLTPSDICIGGVSHDISEETRNCDLCVSGGNNSLRDSARPNARVAMYSAEVNETPISTRICEKSVTLMPMPSVVANVRHYAPETMFAVDIIESSAVPITYLREQSGKFRVGRNRQPTTVATVYVCDECQHWFHEQCMRAWQAAAVTEDRGGGCPMCRLEHDERNSFDFVTCPLNAASNDAQTAAAVLRNIQRTTICQRKRYLVIATTTHALCYRTLLSERNRRSKLDNQSA